jgi:hypothetical protein
MLIGLLRRSTLLCERATASDTPTGRIGYRKDTPAQLLQIRREGFLGELGLADQHVQRIVALGQVLEMGALILKQTRHRPQPMPVHRHSNVEGCEKKRICYAWDESRRNSLCIHRIARRHDEFPSPVSTWSHSRRFRAMNLDLRQWRVRLSCIG